MIKEKKMPKAPKTVYQNETTPTEILTIRPDLPADYHTEEFTENFDDDFYYISHYNNYIWFIFIKKLILQILILL
jgi:hypothetical protein